MADKTIGELPGVTSLDSDSLFVAQQQGVASKVTGAQLTRFANVETAAQVAAAQAAAEGAAASETAAETAKNGAETAQTAIENMTVEAETLAAGAQATVQKIVTSGQPIKLLFGLPTGPTGPAGGVNSFNGRTGAVMPAAGDYTAAMVGAAPGGSGWGDSIGLICADSADESYETYCARVEAVLATMPNYTARLVRAYPPMVYGNSVSTVSVLYKNDDNYAGLFNLGSLDVGLSGWRMIKLRYPDSISDPVWMPFEWVNPPMSLGVEYRTVERYLGKPVYIKLVNCGTFAAPGTVKTVTFDDTGTLLRVIDFGGEIMGSSEVWAFPTFLYGGGYNDWSIVLAEARVSSGIGYIYLYTKTRDLTDNSAYVWVKYTKNTD